MTSCRKHLHVVETAQAQLSLQQDARKNEACLTSQKFDQDARRIALARIIKMVELAFKFVEDKF